MNKKYKLNSIGSILKSLTPVKEQQAKSSELKQLNKIIQAVLDEQTRKHCEVGGIKDNALILITSSPVWQHKIRFFQFEILTKLQNIASFRHVTEVKTRVNSYDSDDLIRKTNSLLAKPKISTNSARVVNSMAEMVRGSSEKLCDALKRITERAWYDGNK